MDAKTLTVDRNELSAATSCPDLASFAAGPTSGGTASPSEVYHGGASTCLCLVSNKTGALAPPASCMYWSFEQHETSGAIVPKYLPKRERFNAHGLRSLGHELRYIDPTTTSTRIVNLIPSVQFALPCDCVYLIHLILQWGLQSLGPGVYMRSESHMLKTPSSRSLLVQINSSLEMYRPSTCL